jgi:hypothetical protein
VFQIRVVLSLDRHVALRGLREGAEPPPERAAAALGWSCTAPQRSTRSRSSGYAEVRKRGWWTAYDNVLPPLYKAPKLVVRD